MTYILYPLKLLGSYLTLLVIGNLKVKKNWCIDPLHKLYDNNYVISVTLLLLIRFFLDVIHKVCILYHDFNYFYTTYSVNFMNILCTYFN